MLGLSGFRLLAVSDAYDELEQAVETTPATAWCADCGVQAVRTGGGRWGSGTCPRAAGR